MADYIGSVISLVSLSDIRYRGRLTKIDTEQATIALEQVRSLGTEGRRGDGNEIPPNETVYDYVVFRASDVKDLQIESNAAPEPTPPPQPQFSDPAIVNHRGPPGQFPPYGAPNQFGPPPPGHFGAPGQQPYYYGPPGGPQFGQQPMYGSPFAPPPPAFPQPQQPQQPQQAPGQQQQSQQPSAPAQKPIGPPPSQQTPIAAPQAQRPITAATAAALGAPAPPVPAAARPEESEAPKPAVQAPKAKAPEPVAAPQPSVNGTAPSAPAPKANAWSTGASSAIRTAPGAQPAQAEDDVSKSMSQLNVGGPTRRGGRGRGGAPPNGATQERRPVPGNDFDFGASNALFAKEEGEPVASPVYDKKSSFFDDISSDQKSRADNQRFDRQKERAQNIEAFGKDLQVRGGFRGGRGRGRGRGRGGPRGRGRGAAPAQV